MRAGIVEMERRLQDTIAPSDLDAALVVDHQRVSHRERVELPWTMEWCRRNPTSCCVGVCLQWHPTDREFPCSQGPSQAGSSSVAENLRAKVASSEKIGGQTWAGRALY
jgi:hypothetical protein